MVRGSPNKRVHPRFADDMKDAMTKRFKAGLMDEKDFRKGMPKITELLTRTQGYHMSLKELKIKPEKQKK